MYSVRKNIVRPEAALVARFRDLATPLLADVMGRQNCLSHDFRPIYKGARICGPAVTVKAYPSDNLMIHAGLKFAQEGDVLVADTGGYCGAGLWGEIMGVNAVRKKLGGLVLDGACRDIDELEALGFPVFCRGINPRGGFKLNGGSVNEPISCGGVCVNPGDLVVADICGVAVVPRAEMAEVLELTTKKLEAEKAVLARLEAGEDFYDIADMDACLRKLGVRFLDEEERS